MGHNIVCVYCETTRSTNQDGTVRKHMNPVTGRECQGSGKNGAFFPLGPAKGPTVARMPTGPVGNFCDFHLSNTCPCAFNGVKVK